MVFKLRVRPAGGHVDVTFFSAKDWDYTFANLGTLTMTAQDLDGLLNTWVFNRGTERIKVYNQTEHVPCQDSPNGEHRLIDYMICEYCGKQIKSQ